MGIDPRRRRTLGWPPLMAGCAVLIASAGLVLGSAKHGAADVHRDKSPGSCLACHSADEPTLHARASVASPMLADDLDARCAACHDPLDASHRTGVVPKRPVPPALPLSADGKVTCATCHFMHAESDAFGDFVRIDNRKGALCLTCHELSELE